MVPVDQTIFGKRGNCLSACFASLFHLGIADVPWFGEHEDSEIFWDEVRKWLAKRDMDIITLNLGDGFDINQVPGYQIIAGDTVRNLGSHAVIYNNGILAHDPHPDRS